MSFPSRPPWWMGSIAPYGLNLISLLANGTEQIFTFSFKEIAMQILFLLWSWVVCLLFVVILLQVFFFLAIFETAVRNPLSHYPAFFYGTVRGAPLCENDFGLSVTLLFLHEPVLPSEIPECCASSCPQTSFLPLSERPCNLKTWERIPLVFGLPP